MLQMLVFVLSAGTERSTKNQMYRHQWQLSLRARLLVLIDVSHVAPLVKTEFPFSCYYSFIKSGGSTERCGNWCLK